MRETPGRDYSYEHPHPRVPQGGAGEVGGATNHTCPSCGEPAASEYCGRCGQRRAVGRFTLRGIFERALAEGLNMDRGLLPTFKGLTLHPGRTVRDYLSGRTRPYTDPVKYLLVFVALSALATLSLGVLEQQAEMMAPGAAETDPRLDRYVELMSRYFNIALILGVPFMAAATRLLFRRAGFNLAEHLIFNTYAYAHQTAIFLPFAVGMAVVPSAFAGLMLGYTAAMTGYYVWASERFFQVGRVRGYLLATAAIVLGYSAYSLVFLTAFFLAVQAA